MHKKANKSVGNSRDEEELPTAAKAEPDEGDRREGRAGRDGTNTNVAPNFQCSSVGLSFTQMSSSFSALIPVFLKAVGLIEKMF